MCNGPNLIKISTVCSSSEENVTARHTTTNTNLFFDELHCSNKTIEDMTVYSHDIAI